MVDFAQTVNAPQAASFTPPKVDSSWISNLYDNFIQGQTDIQKKTMNDQSIAQNKQAQEMNAQAIQQRQMQINASHSLQGGVPTSNGAPDVMALFQKFLSAGDVDSAMKLLPQIQQQQGQNVPTWPQQGQPQQGQPAPQQSGQPQSIPARPLPPVATNSPQGDSAGSVIARVTDALPPGSDDKIGAIAGNMAKALKVDPNAPLTPDQSAKLDRYLAPYRQAGGGAQSTGTGGGNLPPSAAAASPAPPPASPQQQGAPNGAGSAAPQAAPPAPAPPAAPAAAPPGAQAPQQPQPAAGLLPNDPRTGQPIQTVQQAREAVDAINKRIDILSRYPQQAQRVQNLEHQRDQIEQAIKPRQVNSMTTLLGPNNEVIYQGPGAASLANTSHSPTLDADAERYRQTGQLPPNMGRGMQGSMEAKQIRARAAEKEIEEGGDPSQWPDKWQAFKAKGVGLNTAERTKAAREENLNLILKAADAAIPAALEASKNLPRGSYVPLNRLIQKGEIMSSDPRLVEFGMANLQLAEHWARAMNPTGVMRESDRDKALHFLDTAYGSNTYERAVTQLQKQITRERDAVRGGGSILKDGKAPDPGAGEKPSKSEGKPAADGATVYTLPNGSKARVMEVE